MGIPKDSHLTSLRGSFRSRPQRLRLVAVGALFRHDVVDAGLRPTINVSPAVLIANTVALVCNVEHVRLCRTKRIGYRVVRLLICDDDHTVGVLFLGCNILRCLTEVSSTVILRALYSL